MKYLAVYLPLILMVCCFLLAWFSTEEKKEEVEEKPISPKVAFIKESMIPWRRQGGTWKD